MVEERKSVDILRRLRLHRVANEEMNGVADRQLGFQENALLLRTEEERQHGNVRRLALHATNYA